MSETIYSSDFSRVLGAYGFEYLTGESCAISLRILYDMSSRGIRLVENAFSIKIDRSSTPKNWNSQVGGMPAVASIKLSPAQARDLLIFALASTYRFVVYVVAKPDKWSQDYLYCTDDRDDMVEVVDIVRKSNLHDLRRVYSSFDGQPSVGLDNVHAFTGRTV